MTDQISLRVLARPHNSAELHQNQNILQADHIIPHGDHGSGQDNSRASIDPNHKSTRFMQNPLQQYSPEELDVEVDLFVDRNHELEELRELLHLGAQIARDPFAPQAAKDLLPDDQQALKDENERPFRYPLKYWFTIGACCCAAALQGWSEVGIVPGNAAWPQEFGVDRKSGKGKYALEGHK
jgi:hypothetical protein